jgi:hypothetical protein
MATVLLIWQPSPDDPTFGGNVAHYSVRRSNGPNATAEHATVAATAEEGDTFFLDENVAPGTYFWRVNAVSDAGRQSAFSNEVSLTISSEMAEAVIILRLGAVPRLPVALAASSREIILEAHPLNPIWLATHAR